MIWLPISCILTWNQNYLFFQVLAKALLKRLDRSKTYHCEMKFESNEELIEHQASCVLRPVSCLNVGCGAVYSAVHATTHDGLCLHKQLPCELKCGSTVPRGEMERHGVTVCPMKKMKCPFHPVGCLHTMAQVHIYYQCFVYRGFWLYNKLPGITWKKITFYLKGANF